MTRIIRLDSTKIDKRFTLAALILVGLSTILPTAVLARSSLLSGNWPTIDAKFQNGRYVIPGSFYGMYVKNINNSWPTSYLANLGLDEGNGVDWWNIEIAPGQYDFYYLDQWIALSQQHNVILKYTFGEVPQFYSSDPNDRRCVNEPGACDPPNDLNEDGSGTDAAFKNFVERLVAHNAELGNPIQFWDIWDEPNVREQWTPTCEIKKNCTGDLRYAQLLRMAADAYPIIKAANANAIVTTPSPVGWPRGAEEWMRGWLKFGGGHYADVISFDGYVNLPGQFPIAENEYKLIKQMKGVRDGKPLWINAGGWGNVGLDRFSEVLKAAFLARYMLLQQSTGIAQAYWHQWDNLFGAGHLRLAGDAYNSIVNWTRETTLTSACAPQKGTSVWVCKYSRSDPPGYKAEAVWNSKRSSTYTFKQKFVQYCDLKGKVKAVQGKKVPIGIWPILLENENLGQKACQQ